MSFFGVPRPPLGGGTPKNPFLPPIPPKKVGFWPKKIFLKKIFFLKKKSFFSKNRLFLGGLGGADEFFGGS